MKQARERNSQKSKEDILHAAEQEFAEKGLYGARVDEIARLAEINKRMIYEYYGSKEGLYKAVLIDVYGRLAYREIDVLVDEIDPIDAIRKLVRLYFEFLKENPTYVSLLQWENLNKGKYIQDEDFTGIKDSAMGLLKRVIVRGVSEGAFKQDIDVEQVVLSLLTFCFTYFSNRYTLSRLMGKRLEDEENIRLRIKHVTDIFLSYLCN